MPTSCTIAPRLPVRAAVFLAALALSCAGSARAELDDPREWHRFDGWEVTAFAVKGAPPDLQAELVRGLKYTGRRRLLRPRERPVFATRDVLEDVRRIRLFLAARGYPASRVEISLDPRPETRRVAVTANVVVGPEVLVAEIRLRDWPEPVPEPRAAAAGVPAVGERFTDERAQEGVAHLTQLLLDAGYAQAKVDLEIAPLSEDRVALTYVITAGAPYVIGRVTVHGCAEDLVPVARRVLDIRPGTRYGATTLSDAALDLRTTQLFRQVELTTTPVAADSLALDVSLADARWRSLSASLGTWSDNPWVVKLAWTHRNLLRAGRGLRVGGVYATHDQQLWVEVFKLGLLSPRAVTTLGGLAVREDEDAYRSREFAARLQQSFRPRGRGLWMLGVSISNVDVTTYSPDVLDLPESQDWLLETYVDRKWDWTDDLLFPTRGGYVKVGLTYAPAAAFFGASYVKVQADGSVQVPLVQGVRGAARLRLGWSQPLGSNEDLLANRRFYAGGYNTMRGYERRRLGPRDADNNPRGGQAVVLAGCELRRHLIGIFDMAVFLDSGDVWRAPEEASLRWLRSAVGVDLDLRSPLGPVRVGYAWNIGAVLPGEPAELWHFGIGYPW